MTIRLGYLLIDGFAMMSYASLAEPFRAANILSSLPLYDWTHLSVDGAPVAASNGAVVAVDGSAREDQRCDLVFIFAAEQARTFDDPATMAWLRRVARAGKTLVGVSGGPFVLARAGLLGGHRATIHWEHEAALREAYPALDIDRSLFVDDRRRITCAGGTAGLDLAIELIARDHGAALAGRVGEWFIQPDPRAAERSQRQSLADRYRATNRKLLTALAEMERSIEDPVSRQALADAAGVSLRQLERLFLAQLGCGISDALAAMRLDHAAHLLRSTDLPVTEVALACGFRSASHFSRSFKARFGKSPRDSRRPGTMSPPGKNASLSGGQRQVTPL